MHARRIARRPWTGLAAVLAFLLAAACTSNDSNAAPPEPSEAANSSTAPTPAEPMDLDVLVYNIEYGGDASTDAVLRDLDADVVGVLESYNRLPEIAAKTGYPYYNVGLQLLSKYPIHEPSGADGLYALIEVRPGYVVAFFNTHLDYVAYGPRLLAQGTPVKEVLESEDEVRTSSMRILTPPMQRLLAAGYPVVLTGDFNEPSNLDYTQATVGTHPGVDRPIRWPVSEDLLGIGMRDVFREVHPDPVADPGGTWGDVGSRDGVGNRIDYIYASGDIRAADAKLVGESGGPNVDIGFDKWTSDHRAVLASLSVRPVPLPTTVSLDRRMLTRGDKLTVYYNAPDASDVSIAVMPAEATGGDAVQSENVDGVNGSTTIDTASLQPGGYDIAMLDGDKEIARNQFWVRPEKASVQIATDRRTYGVGHPIEVTWDNGPANRWDWIGVYRAAAANPHVDDYLLWGYTGGHDSGALPPSVSGSMTLDGSAQGRPWPLPPGRYVVHYLLTDQYNSAGSTTFRVVS